ncbi:MAG: OmpH family outer membrane protein [Flavobacteriales bacterium]|nr:OmpH family outer membrane protein [Flavobacteriales bacterium]MDG1781777.1 OmpH family outer membrane protein [Flavobacteriales bacterium]
MKKLLSVFSMILLLGGAVQAQKFAYVNTDEILEHMPEFYAAQAQLNQMSAQWQEEIEAKYEALRVMEESYKAEKILLSKEMVLRREEDIRKTRTEAQEMQRAKFGVGGELFTQREQLIQPVQNAIAEAIKDIASSSGYMVIFDKSNQSNMLYTNPKYDVTDRVIKKLGYTPGEKPEAANQDDKGGNNAGSKGDKTGGGSKGGAGGKTGGNSGSMQRK